MRKNRSLLALLVVLATLLTCIPAASAAGKQVSVATADELMRVTGNNLSDNTTIVLTGKEYVLPEGESLWISGVQHVVLKGSNASIYSSVNDEQVLFIMDSDDVTIEGVSLGHDPRRFASGMCFSGVVYMENSTDVEIRNCDIFGCGWLGISAYNTSFGLRNSTIRDCASNAIEADNVDSYVENCRFYNNGGYSEEPCVTGGVTIENCFFYNNRNSALSGRYMLTEDTPRISNCTYYHNAWGGDNTAFLDVAADSWAQENIAKAAEKGFINGTGDGSFNPTGEVTYSAFANMIVKGFFQADLQAYAGATNPWYLPACTIAANRQLFSGTAYTSPSQGNATSMTRKDLAMFLYNLVRSVDSSKLPQNIQSAGIPDIGGYSQAYQTGIRTAYTLGLMNGTDARGTFNGEGRMTRAEAATVMMRVYSLLEGSTPSATPSTPSTPSTPTTPSVPEQPSEEDQLKQKQEEILRLVNEERAKVGAKPLTLDPLMCQAAQIRAKELPTLFSHTRPDGTNCFTALDDVGFDWAVTCGENIAAGSSTAAGTMNQWMNSPGHKANILQTDFTRLGVGVVQAQDMYGWYWVQMFSGG